tara:strand:- start:416 stop:700 length:285 start_codon:yes stop_codon:yes gene_type:complete
MSVFELAQKSLFSEGNCIWAENSKPEHDLNPLPESNPLETICGDMSTEMVQEFTLKTGFRPTDFEGARPTFESWIFDRLQNLVHPRINRGAILH